LLFSLTVCHAGAQEGACFENLTSVTPSTWIAGQPTNVTYTGSGFTDTGMEGCWFGNATFFVTFETGSMPTVAANIISDSEATSTVTISADAPTQTACVTVADTAIGGVILPPDTTAMTPDICLLFGGIPVQIIGACTAPTITSVKPSTWFAGKTYNNAVIKGTGFITTDKATAACPVTAVSIAAADGSAVPVSGVTVVDKTMITVTVKPPASDPTETATVTVGTAPNTGTTASLATPPQILGNQIQCDPSMNCTQSVISTTDGSEPPAQSVVVGQPIILTTNPNLPINPYKATWKVGGTNIAAYSVASDASIATVTPTVLNTSSLNTYWVYPQENIPVTYQYCVNIPGVGNQCSDEAKTSFNVTGPAATIMSTPTSWSVSPEMSCPSILQLLYFGYPDPITGCSHKPLVKGIFFKAALSNLPVLNGTAVNGKTEWVQLILKNSLSGVSLSGAQAIPANLGVGLDNTYPYGSDDSTESVTTEASDSPSNDLDPALARERRKFKADMYYLWKPQISGSIFVPLGYVEWSTSGTGVQHTKDSPPWSLASSGATSAVFHVSSDTGNTHGYPIWSGTVLNSQSNGSEDGDEDEEQEEQQ